MPKKQTTTPVTLSFPGQYIFTHMVNRFAIEREKGFALAYFCLITQNGTSLDPFRCVFPEHMLKSQKENLVQYSDKIGLPKMPIPALDTSKLEFGEWGIPVVDYIHLCNWDDAYAEICFWSYSQAMAADMGKIKDPKPLTPWGVALLRCEIDLQRAFLEALYDKAPL